MSFNEFIKKHNLRNKATPNIKNQQVLNSIGLNNVGIYSGDGPFSIDIGIVNLHPSKRTRWICYINENSFDSYGCVCPKKLSNFIIKRNGYCLYSEYKKQGLINKRDFYCGSYSFYIIYLTKVLGIDFETSVLILYYQRIS